MMNPVALDPQSHTELPDARHQARSYTAIPLGKRDGVGKAT